MLRVGYALQSAFCRPTRATPSVVTMFTVINAPDGAERIGFSQVEAPVAAANQVLVDVRAFSVNRGELALLQARPAGWRPGQDIAGTVAAAAADGSGPAVGTRVVGRVEGGGWAE